MVFSLASAQLAEDPLDALTPRLGPWNQVLPFLPHQRKALEKALLAREVGGGYFPGLENSLKEEPISQMHLLKLQ